VNFATISNKYEYKISGFYTLCRIFWRILILHITNQKSLHVINMKLFLFCSNTVRKKKKRKKEEELTWMKY